MFMKPVAILLFIISVSFLSCRSQTNNSNISGGMSATANKYLETLSARQKAKTQFSFDEQERYNWHYIPKDRKGISLSELNDDQRKAAMNLLRTALSDTGYHKTIAIIELEAVLRESEGRPSNDDYRDPGKYYFSIFGNPAADSIWGWRLEGHHISFNFSAKNNLLVSGTPGFLGANPAIVLSGPEKGKQILKDETELGFALLHSLDAKQMDKAIISAEAPGEIITGASRKAMISDPRGILYSELNAAQQKNFLQLLSIYIHRYTRLFAMDMMHEIENAGLTNLRFAWAGAKQPGPGNPHYYRIQGPTIIIEYDNTQNNANHVHTVVRDLKRDFGGDELLEHYKKGHN
jgi:Protein of unknown function (DUF3500)